jgi:FkbM family methyltransferase
VGRYRHEFTRFLLDHGLLGDDAPLHVTDVGVSGGLDVRWDALGPGLSAVGFDPLTAEIERLRAADTRPGVKYEDAAVTCRGYEGRLPHGTRDHDPYLRSSAVAAQQLVQQDYIREHFNAGAEVRYSSRAVTLDEYYEHAAVTPNFLKVDTDGHDLSVLLGAERLLHDGNLLGVQVEAQFHGYVHELSNIFSNIDRLLRARGFTLYDLPAYRYSRGVLPAPFAIDAFAQTVTGQVLWGEALYFRDFADPGYAQAFGHAAERGRLLKLACLWNLYDFDDCAAELLLRHEHLVAPPLRTQLLDLLTRDAGGGDTYAALMARFTADPRAFLRSRYADRGDAPPASSATPAGSDAAAAPVAVPSDTGRASAEQAVTTPTDPAAEDAASEGSRLARLEEHRDTLAVKVAEYRGIIQRLKARNGKLKAQSAQFRQRLDAQQERYRSLKRKHFGAAEIGEPDPER